MCGKLGPPRGDVRSVSNLFTRARTPSYYTHPSHYAPSGLHFPVCPQSFSPSFRTLLRPGTTVPRECGVREVLGDAVLRSSSMLRSQIEEKGKTVPTHRRRLECARSPVSLYSCGHPGCHSLTPELIQQLPPDLPANLRTIGNLHPYVERAHILTQLHYF